MKFKSWIFPLLFFPVFFLLTNFSSSSPPKQPVHAKLLYEESSVKPGRPFSVGIHITLEPGWHIYWKNPGDAGMAPEITWDLPEGFTAAPIIWPAPQKFTTMEMIGYGYEEETIFLTEITPPSTYSESDSITLKGQISWVACDESNCLPGETGISAHLPIKKRSPKVHLPHAPHFSQARAQIPQKIEGAHVTRREEMLCLHIPFEIDQAQFFPENLDQIDEETEILFTKNEGKTAIALKEKEGSEHSTLKGVIVFKKRAPLEIDLPLPKLSNQIAMNEKEPLEREVSLESSSSQGLWLTLIFAFLGGLCLNAMPCVLPVVSFKVLSFVKMAGESRFKIVKHTLIFTLGILLSFWALAGVFLLLKAWGHSLGWGFQLQEPLFVAFLAAIIFIFGLSLFGVFEFGTKIAAFAGQADAQPKTGLSSSFFSGVLATAVATPCSGPFLGTAIGLAVTLSTFQAMTVFSSLALGMASPYLLLGAFPQFLRFMPKPGNWMGTFKELMGWMMLATVLWLIWVFGAQTSSMALSLLIGSFFLMAIGCWIFGKWGTPFKKKRIRRMAIALSFVFLIFGAYGLVQASRFSEAPTNQTIAHGEDGWIPFSQEKLEQLQAEGTPVFIDFTAKWCLTCQANHFVLEQQEINEQFKKRGVVKMLADWTKKDSAITEALARLGRNSVPVYALYEGSKGKKPILLPQLLSQSNVVEHLEKIEN